MAAANSDSGKKKTTANEALSNMFGFPGSPTANISPPKTAEHPGDDEGEGPASTQQQHTTGLGNGSGGNGSGNGSVGVGVATVDASALSSKMGSMHDAMLAKHERLQAEVAQVKESQDRAGQDMAELKAMVAQLLEQTK